jgi:muramoyltetrapeptide carboxypeptidase
MKANTLMNRLPPRLCPGDAVGIAAPSSPFERDRFEAGVNILSDRGLVPVLSDGIWHKTGYLAGTDAQRAKGLNALFADGQIKAIFCARGGYGALRTLPLIDWESLSRHPKIVVGFSDITALLSGLLARAGQVTFHGPMVTTLADSVPEDLDTLFQALGSDKPIELALDGPVLSPGKCSGPVMGGNLTTLSHLVQTPYFPCLEKAILFLEDRAEAPYRIDRMLTHMKMAGCFQSLSGVVLGSFQDCGSLQQIQEIAADIFGGLHIPVAAGLPAGHGARNQTLVLGLEATLDTTGKSLSYNGPATCLPKPEAAIG